MRRWLYAKRPVRKNVDLLHKSTGYVLTGDENLYAKQSWIYVLEQPAAKR